MKVRRRRGILAVAVLVLCVLLLCGCTGRNVQSPPADTAPRIYGADERAALFEQLASKFENPDVHYKLARSFRGDGLWAQAKYHLETALRFDPANRPSQAALVKLLTDSGRQADASDLANRFINQVDSSATETLKLASAFRDEGLDEYALLCYQQAARIAPDEPDSYRQMGYYYLSKGDEDKAKEYFKKSFSLDPSQADVAAELGRLGVMVHIVRDSNSTTENSG